MARIRTARQAARLRPVAVERARHSALNDGDAVFFGGICYGMVTIERVYDGKPYRYALLGGGHVSFFGPLTHAYRTRDEYEASGVHWNGPPKVRR